MSTQTVTHRQEESLNRSITGRLLFFYVLGDVLGSGIYALVGVMAAEVGGAFWTSFLVGITVAMLTGFAYAELITKYPQAAGAALYVNKAFRSNLLTFVVTFCMLSASIAACGALALVFGGDYFQSFVEVPTTWVAIGFILLLSILNWRGISESVWATVLMTLVEFTGLLIVLGVGVVVLGSGDADLSAPFQFNEGNTALVILGGAAVAFFAMTGFENAANVAEETQHPSTVFPRSLLGGMAVAGLLYLLVSFTASMVAPVPKLAASESALLEVVKAGPIPIPALVFSAIALVAVTNTTLVALVAQSRIMYGMGRQNVVPRVFSRTDSSRRTPWVAIAFCTALVLVLLVTADVEKLANVTVLFLITVYGLVCVSALVLRKQTVEHKHYTAPTALLYGGVLLNVALLGYTAYTEPEALLYCGGMLLVGGALYALNRVAMRRSPRLEADESYQDVD